MANLPGDTPRIDELDGVVQELDISNNNGIFSAAQPPIKIARTGNIAVMSWQNIAHSNLSAPATVSGFIPAEFRPGALYGALVNMGSAEVFLLTIAADGTLTWTYRGWAGALDARTSTGNGTISWIIG